MRLLSVFVTDEEFTHLTDHPSSADLALCKVKQRNGTKNRSRVSDAPQTCDLNYSSSDSIPSSCKSEELTVASHQTIESNLQIEDDTSSTFNLSEHSGCESQIVECNGCGNNITTRIMRSNLEPMELYILGNSQSVFLLFTDPGSIRDSELRLKLVCIPVF